MTIFIKMNNGWTISFLKIFICLLALTGTNFTPVLGETHDWRSTMRPQAAIGDKPGVVSLSPNTRQYNQKENSDISPIRCKALCNPPCTYHWMFNGRNIGGQSDVLTLNNTQRAEAGSYWCTATNDLGSSNSLTLTVNVLYGPRAVDLSPNNHSYTLVEGTRGRLNTITCSANCNPNCTFQWSRDGTVVKWFRRQLWLTTATQADTGTYKCHARNAHGKMDSASVTVTVEHGPRAVYLSPNNHSYTLVEGTRYRLNTITCSADCNPTCTFQWKRDGRVSISRTNQIWLTGATRADAGTYKCNARNAHGNKDSSQVTVNVQYGPRAVYLSPNNHSYILVEGTRDRLNTITCFANCNPTCTFQWSRDGNVVKRLSRQLLLTRATEADTGTYKCNARNAHGNKDSASVTVTVEYGPRSVYLSPNNHSYTLVEGTRDRLNTITCYAYCNPTCTFQWLRERTVVRALRRHSWLTKATQADAGTYKCNARNAHGNMDSASLTVTVEYPPRTLVLTPSNQSYQILEYVQSLRIEGHADCNPQCSYRWEKDNQFHVNGRILSLPTITRAQSGVFKCHATNKHGSSFSAGVYVEVQYAPENTAIVEKGSRNVSENSQLSLTCTTDSVPPSSMELRLERNGQRVVNHARNTILKTFTKPAAGCTDTGQYFCVAQNMLGNSTSQKIDINVICSPRPMKGFKTKNDVGIGDNDSLSITGSVVAFPPPIISWMFKRNGADTPIMLFNATDDFEIYTTSTYVTHASQIKKSVVASMDFGDYIMNASNPYGSILMLYHVSSKRKHS